MEITRDIDIYRYGSQNVQPAGLSLNVFLSLDRPKDLFANVDKFPSVGLSTNLFWYIQLRMD
jgi:hypothetical protein